MILGGTGADSIYGYIPPNLPPQLIPPGIAAGPGASALGSGSIIFGDNGQVVYSGGVLAQVVTTYPSVGSSDTINGDEGPDTILGGPGNDAITTGNGDNVVFGDDGSIAYETSGLLPVPDVITSIDPNVGGNDGITAGNGNNVIIAGSGSDRVKTGNGGNLIFGDDAQVDYAFGLIAQAMTIVPNVGGNDAITTGSGPNSIVGGAGSDMISTGGGDNVVIGDLGVLAYAGGSIANIHTTDPQIGAADVIKTGSGDDTILGGTGADSITAGDGDNRIAGDFGKLVYKAGVLASFTSTFVQYGGSDAITAGSGADYIIGGVGGDQIHAGDGKNIVAGDNARITFLGGTASDVLSTSTNLGGADLIVSGTGSSILIGGAGGDSIRGGTGDDVILGDNGHVALSGGSASRIETISATTGGNDSLSGGFGNDTILGGAGNDSIDGGAGNDLLLGDCGFVLPGAKFGVGISTTDPTAGGNDSISTGSGTDTVLGGPGRDTIRGGLGDDVIFGDNASGTPTTGGGTAAHWAFTSIDVASGGNDLIYGGSGKNTLVGGTGRDSIYGGATSDLIFGDQAQADSTQSGGYSSAFIMTAAAGDDDVINAGGGKDTIFGEQGDDSIKGGAGSDLMNGGFGLAGGGAPGSDVILGGTGTAMMTSDLPLGVPAQGELASYNFQFTNDFQNLVNPFTTQVGSWSISGGKLLAQPGTGTSVAVRTLNVSSVSNLDLIVPISTTGQAGIVFDFQSNVDYKYVALDPANHQVLLGHRTSTNWVTDASVTASAGALPILAVTLRGKVVSVYLNGTKVLTHTYASLSTTGQVGLYAHVGSSSFGFVQIRGDGQPSAAPFQISLPSAMVLTTAAPSPTTTAPASLSMGQLNAVTTPQRRSGRMCRRVRRPY